MTATLFAMTTDFHQTLVATLPRLRRHALMLTRNRTATDDLVQDTVVRVLAGQAGFEPGSNFNAWTNRILRNEFISGIRRRRQELPYEGLQEELVATPASQIDALALGELVVSIDRLPDRQRDALMMSMASELNYDQIAKTMNCRAGTIKSRISRAREQLRIEQEGTTVGEAGHAWRGTDGAPLAAWKD